MRVMSTAILGDMNNGVCINSVAEFRLFLGNYIGMKLAGTSSTQQETLKTAMQLFVFL